MTDFTSPEFQSGIEYLECVTVLHDNSDDLFAHSPLDELAEEARINALTADLGVVGFLTDFARDRRRREENMSRWETGNGLPQVAPEMLELIASKTPAHVSINPEALGAIEVRRTRDYKIDRVSDDIMAEVTALLPRKLDAYHYKQGYATDTIAVDGLGEVEVRMSNSQNVFHSISEIKVGNFRIWNCRQTGLWYNGNWIDNSHPSDIEIGDEKLEINLYDDESGIFVKKDGKSYTNERVRARFGSGYRTDADRDELYRTYNGGNEMATVRDGEAPNDDWRDDETEYSWAQIQDAAIVWMAENVLFPLRGAEKPAEQATEAPEAEPFPYDKIGPIFTFIETKDYERIKRIQQKPEAAYPNERHGIRPNLRLVSLGDGTPDLPSEVHDGYIYAKPGRLNEATNFEEINKIGREYRKTDRILGGAHGFAQLRPKSARDIYVVDWAEWDKYRDATFSDTHNRLSDEELKENHAVVARTMTPVIEYDDSFEDPIIIIGRDLELDEIELMFPAPDTRR